MLFLKYSLSRDEVGEQGGEEKRFGESRVEEEERRRKEEEEMKRMRKEEEGILTFDETPNEVFPGG